MQPLNLKLNCGGQGEIEGLWRARESETRDRETLMERIERLERENIYLNAQLQMEQKSRSDYKETVRAAQRAAEEAAERLGEKKRELNDRTQELMYSQQGQEDLMEQGIQRMQEVESYTVRSMQLVRGMQQQIAGMMAQRLQARTCTYAVRRWRSQTSSVMGRMELLRRVHQRYVNHVLGKPLSYWRKHADFVMFLSTALPRLALRRRRNLLALSFRCWRAQAARSARAKMHLAMQDMKAQAGREAALAAQLREAEEMLAEAYAAQNKVEKVVRDVATSKDRETQEVRDLLEAALAEERRVRLRLEDASKELKSVKGAEQATRAALAEHLQSHKEETDALRERLRASESAFDGLKVKLNESLARQRDLEDMLTKKESLSGDKAHTINKLQSSIVELERDSKRLMQQLHSEETSRQRAEASRHAMQCKLEELERSSGGMVRGRQAADSKLQAEYDEEMRRRCQLEDALAKLIKAFKDAKQEHRQKLMQAGDYVRILAAFFEWKRAIDRSAQAGIRRELDMKLTASPQQKNRESPQEISRLQKAVRQLSAELEESRDREEASNAARATLEAQVCQSTHPLPAIIHALPCFFPSKYLYCCARIGAILTGVMCPS